MNKWGYMKILGVIIFFIGKFLVLAVFLKMTGNVVIEGIGTQNTSFLGVLLIISGISLFVAGIRKKKK